MKIKGCWGMVIHNAKMLEHCPATLVAMQSMTTVCERINDLLVMMSRGVLSLRYALRNYA